MSSAYKLTELKDVQAGMVLGADLRDQQGQLLLPEGASLTDTMLASLARHEITMLPLRQEQVDTVTIDVTAVQARLDRLFRKNVRDDSDDWATGILRKYLEDFRLGREVAP